MGTSGIPITVLYVGTGRERAAAVTDALESEICGATVETTAYAADAVRRISTGEVDLLLSESHLTTATGLELLDRVRDTRPELPFLLYTDGDGVTPSDAIDAGVTDYIEASDDGVRPTVLAHRVQTVVAGDQSRAEESPRSEQVEQFCKAVPSCIVELDLDGNFVYANRRAEDVLGLTRSEVTDRSFDDEEWSIRDLDAKPIPEEELPFALVVESGEPVYDYRHAIRWPDGTRKVLSVNGAPLFDETGSIQSVVFSLTDVTDRMRRKHELERYERLIEQLGDIATIIDPDGTISYVSPSVERVLGYEPEDLLGQNGFSHQPPETSDAVAEGIEEVLANPDEIVTVQTKFRRADGSYCWIESTLQNYVDDEVIGGILVSSRDVSDRIEQTQRLERRERQMQQIHETTRKLLRADDPEGVAAMASSAATEVLDFPMNGIHFDDEGVDGLVPVAVSDRSREVLDEVPTLDDGIAVDAYRNGETRVHQHLGDTDEVFNPETPIGSEIYLPLEDHGVFLVSAEETDAFDKLDIELARVLAANTEAALQRITREQQLQDQRAELKRQNERLDKFASVVSHDLRNPLSIATGRTELALDTGEIEHLEPVVTAHDRMESLIDDLLTLARQGQAIDETESVDLAAVARQSFQSVGDADAECLVESTQSVRADEGRLRQLIENLLRNAADHSDGAVTVRVGDLPDGFFVADDGPGVPEDERTSVFDPGHSTAEQGTGFGLAIVERVVDAHGWEIDLTESADGGARFEIRGVTVET